MIDLHTHSLLSDGELLPSELIRRAAAIGYEAIAITDHVDISNYDFVIPRIVKACRQAATELNHITVIPGAELTHINPDDIPLLVKEARSLGARLIVVHGETIVEPVRPGTNRKALESDVDILAHPGLIAEEDVRLAQERNIALEVTARKGHSLTNGHVVKLARQYGARLILNTDAHAPDDLLTLERAQKIAMGAGLSQDDFNDMLQNSRAIIKTAS
ncbi:MAG: histidinol phosphate phosphatase domain-containing protein [Proteobacteria bacterium]|nr:histidinol phosphate phosphatase domain-containing protein [Pseudomonadota bacterium]